MTSKYKVVSIEEHGLDAGRIFHEHARGDGKHVFRNDSLELERIGSPNPLSRQGSWMEAEKLPR